MQHTHAWVNRVRRLPILYERGPNNYEVFTSLAARLVKLNKIKRLY